MITRSSDKPPFNEKIINPMGAISRSWEGFFRRISEVLRFIGQEYSFTLVNNQATAAAITGLIFDYQYTSAVFVDYVIQRVTSTTSKIQMGVLICTYNPSTLAWSIAEYGTSGPDAAGITFTIVSGQVKYTSTNLGGTESISRMVFRVREIAAKGSYSKIG